MITLQEVRLDSSFFSIAEDSSMPTWTAAPDYRKVDAGAQVEHLLQHLRDAQARLGLHSIDYQVGRKAEDIPIRIWKQMR